LSELILKIKKKYFKKSTMYLLMHLKLPL